MKLKRNKSLIFALAIFTILTFVGMRYVLSSEDNSGGSVIISNTGPDVTAVELTSSSFDVATNIYINASITDINELNDLDTIIYYIYNSNDSTWDGLDDITEHYTIMYDDSSDTWSCSPSGYLTDGYNNIVPSDKSQISGAYKAYFNFSTVAHYVGQYWYVRVWANDSAGQSDFMSSSAFTVNKYTSIDINEATFNFGTIAPDTTDNVIADPGDGNLTINVVSNYNYTLRLKTSAWSSYDSKFTITRDAGDGTEITESYVDWQINQAPETTEAGEDRNLALFLDVASGVPADSYSFTLYAEIANL